MAKSSPRHYGSFFFFFCPQCPRRINNPSAAVQQSRSLDDHNRFLASLDSSAPPNETLLQRKNRATKNHQGVISSPIFPFLYNSIVPPPLHIYLGLGNQLIQLVQSELLEEKDRLDFSTYLKKNKATSQNVSGAHKYSAGLALNGGELKKVVHCTKFFNFIDRIKNEEKKIYFHILLQSFQSLIPFLLSHESLDRGKLTEFTRLVIFIGEIWIRNRNTIKPKIHMLSHCAAFAKEQQTLGVFNECAIESTHHDVHLTFENHSNRGQNTINKERRTQSDISQHRISRVCSGRVKQSPNPRVCKICGQYSAKYMNNNVNHVCFT